MAELYAERLVVLFHETRVLLTDEPLCGRCSLVDEYRPPRFSQAVSQAVDLSEHERFPCRAVRWPDLKHMTATSQNTGGAQSGQFVWRRAKVAQARETRSSRLLLSPYPSSSELDLELEDLGQAAV